MHISTINAINELLFIQDQPERVDLIFVLGSREMNVIKKAVELFHNNFSPMLLISGGIHENRTYTTKEADLFKEYALQQNISESNIIIESDATNTKENFTFTKKLIEEKIGFKNLNKVMLIIKNFHCRRALMTAKQWWPKHIEYIIIPIMDERNIQPDNWWLNEISKTRVLDELRRISEYAIKGDLDING